MTPPTNGEDPARGSSRRSSLALAVLLAISLVPFAMSIGRAAASGWTPSGDQAMEILRMHDVGTSHTPLLGPYSRFGWDHPGPLLFWIGAPALRLAGPAGVMVLVGLLNVAATVGAVAAARRLAGDAFALAVTAAVAVMVHSHGAAKLIDPWNPWVTVLPLLCYLFCVPVAVARQSRWALLAAVATGSFVAQSHLGNVPVVLAAAGSGVAWWWIWERTDRDDPGTTHETGPSWRRFLWPLGLAVLLWAGPIVDTVVNAPGNLWELARFATGSTEDTAPLGDSLGVAARELGLWPAWSGAHEGVWPVAAAPVVTLLFLPAAMGAGLVWARRRDGLYPVRAEGIVGYTVVVYVAAAFAVTRTTGGLIPYVLRWTWPVAMLALVVALLPLLQTLATVNTSRVHGAEPHLPAKRGITVLTTVAALVVTVASGAAVAEGRRMPIEPSPQTDRSVGPLSDAIREVLPKGDYALEWFDVRSFSAISIGTGVDLTRHGYEIDFPTDHASRVGEFRATGRTDLPLLILVGQTPVEFFIPPDGAELITEWDHLTPEERTRAEMLEERIRATADIDDDMLVAVDNFRARDDLAANGADRGDVDALHALEGDRESYQVWLAPPGTLRDL